MMRCEDVIERLPWWLNSTLEEKEGQELATHLEGCSSCREELELVRQASALYAGHIPVVDLSDYGLGLKLTGMSREVLELHLAHCDLCREDLALVKDGLIAQEAPHRRPMSRWRDLALAASVAAVFALAWPIWQAPNSPPRANVVMVELLPESFATRGEDPPPETLESTMNPVVLLLITDRAEEYPDVRIRVTDANHKIVWEASGLQRSETGEYPVLIPQEVLPAEEMEITLEGLEEDGWIKIETYRLRVSGS